MALGGSAAGSTAPRSRAPLLPAAKRHLTPDIPHGRSEILPPDLGQLVLQNGHQPGPELFGPVSLKPFKNLLCLKERLLDEVRRPNFGPHILRQSAVGHQQQIAATRLQQSAQRLAMSGADKPYPIDKITRFRGCRPVFIHYINRTIGEKTDAHLFNSRPVPLCQSPRLSANRAMAPVANFLGKPNVRFLRMVAINAIGRPLSDQLRRLAAMRVFQIFRAIHYAPVGDFPTLAHVLQARAVSDPQRCLYIFLGDGETESARFTYSELDEQARRIASQLIQLQACGERALLIYPSGLEFVSALFGCFYSGVIAVPAVPDQSPRAVERFKRVIADCQAKIVLTTESLSKVVREVLVQEAGSKPLHCLVTDQPFAEPDRIPCPPLGNPDDLAFLQYTSGSTSDPKGIAVSHANLLENQRMFGTSLQTSEKIRIVTWLPIYHDLGLIGQLLHAPYVGGSCVFMPPQAFLQRPLRWLRAIDRYRGTYSASQLRIRVVREKNRRGRLRRSRPQLLDTGRERGGAYSELHNQRV